MACASPCGGLCSRGSTQSGLCRACTPPQRTAASRRRRQQPSIPPGTCRHNRLTGSCLKDQYPETPFFPQKSYHVTVIILISRTVSEQKEFSGFCETTQHTSVPTPLGRDGLHTMVFRGVSGGGTWGQGGGGRDEQGEGRREGAGRERRSRGAGDAGREGRRTWRGTRGLGVDTGPGRLCPRPGSTPKPPFLVLFKNDSGGRERTRLHTRGDEATRSRVIVTPWALHGLGSRGTPASAPQRRDVCPTSRPCLTEQDQLPGLPALRPTGP